MPSCRKTAHEILARKEELGELLSREEGKTLPEGIGEVTRAGADLRVLRRRSAAAGGRSPAVGAARRRRRNHAASRSASSASSRRGISRSPSRAGRSRRRSATATRWCSSRPTWCRARPGRSSTSCIAPGCPRACSTSSWARARWSGRPCSTARTSTPSPSPARSAPGKRVAEAAIKVSRKFQLEMGGKNPTDRARRRRPQGGGRERGAESAFFSTGQRCTASSRIIVTEGIHDKFVEALSERMQEPQGRRCDREGHRDRPGGRSEPAQAGHWTISRSARRKAPSWRSAASR